MRILHTSDWHLGATLEGVSRHEDHSRFLDWLAGAVERESVDVLVIAGDVFDQAHPSAEAQGLYFRFLRRVGGGRLSKVVVVGGNHDSASRLDAPRDVLDSLRVHVVGGLSSDEDGWDRCLCPVSSSGESGVDAVVLAVPFVHEHRLGVRTTSRSPEELGQAFRDRFREFYRELVERALSRHDGAPVIATGHLTCVGFEPGDFPADIHQVGSIGGLPADVFDERLQYVALGHIHRSYQVGASRAHYSGTPVALSLKEARTPRKVRLVELAQAPEGTASVRTLEVPSSRAIVELRGEVREVGERLRALTWDEPLRPLVYARVTVERFTPGVEEELRSAVAAMGAEGPLLVQVRQERRMAEGEQVPVPAVTSLAELSPEEVFLRLCQERGEAVDESLLVAFRSLLSAPEEEKGAA